MVNRSLFFSLFLLLIINTPIKADPGDNRIKIPVKEVTIFKDGHVFVLHEGGMPTDSAGNVWIDSLPAPILGTFWPYSADRQARLTGVVAGLQKVTIDHTALDIRALIAANPGAEVIVTETTTQSEPAVRYNAVIIGIPEPKRENPPLSLTVERSAEPIAVAANIVLLKTTAGVKALEIGRIRDITFVKDPKLTVNTEVMRNRLQLKLDWAGKAREQTANVGLVYVQKGIRWIPSYKVSLDAGGKAVLKLQATLLNELEDLENVTANLVIGVPTFLFKETLDPIAFQNSGPVLSQYFNTDRRNTYGQVQALDNAIATQTARMGEYRQPVSEASAEGVNLPGAPQNEDLFIFTLKNITLKKGERMVLTVAEETISYKDVYTMEVPFVPPPDIVRNLNSTQQAEIARLLNAPKLVHKLRLTNSGKSPLTTAPALIMREGQVLAEGLMPFTAVGASTDLEITKAVDIQVKKKDIETKRTPNAARWHNEDLGRVDLAGTISLVNYRNQPVYVEITRHVLGNVDSANEPGQIEKVNFLEDDRPLPTGEASNYFGYYNWPRWWNSFNGVGRITWKLTIPAGKGADLKYAWHYFWQ